MRTYDRIDTVWWSAGWYVQLVVLQQSPGIQNKATGNPYHFHAKDLLCGAAVSTMDAGSIETL